MLFLRDRGGARAILRVDPKDCTFGFGGGSEVIFMTATMDPDAFFEGWQRHADEHAYLRGERFYASGEFTPPLHSAQVAWAEIGRMGLMFPSSRCSSLHFTAGGIGAQRSAQSRHSPSDFLRNAK
jgi:hypothetical protein